MTDNPTANIRSSGSTIEISVPKGTSLEAVFATDGLIDAIRRLGGGGCEACTSGRDLIIRDFDDMIEVSIKNV